MSYKTLKRRRQRKLSAARIKYWKDERAHQADQAFRNWLKGYVSPFA